MLIGRLVCGVVKKQEGRKLSAGEERPKNMRTTRPPLDLISRNLIFQMLIIATARRALYKVSVRPGRQEARKIPV